MAKISTDTTVTLYKFKCSCDRKHGKEDWGNHCGRCGVKVQKVAAGKQEIGFGEHFCPCCQHKIRGSKPGPGFYCENCRKTYQADFVQYFDWPRCQVCDHELRPGWNKFCEGCGADMETALTIPDPKTLSWFKRNGVFVWLTIAIISVLALTGGLIWLVVKVVG